MTNTTKQAIRIILLLFLPVLLYYSFTILSDKDCLWSEPHRGYSVSDFGGTGTYELPCGFPLKYEHYLIHSLLNKKALQEGENISALVILVLDIAFLVVPICVWFYIFRKTRPHA
jgi:hypothetical protein